MMCVLTTGLKLGYTPNGVVSALPITVFIYINAGPHYKRWGVYIGNYGIISILEEGKQY